MKTILITGGAGYLGRNLALSLKDKYKVVLGSRNYQSIRMAANLTGCTAVPMDVSNIESIREVINTFQPNIIVHAAASKYIDSAEVNPNECIDVNVVGSQNIARVAMDKGVELVIGISTDKASPPCKSIYGLSKSLVERLFVRLNGKTQTSFFCIRFGNISWSTGSVFPIWQGMLKKDNVIYTTGPEMRRFMLSVKDACHHIETAISHSHLLTAKILAPKLKVVKIADALEVFVRIHGGAIRKAPPREVDSIDEIMIGATEMKHLSMIELKGRDYYLIDYSSRQAQCEVEAITTFNGERMSQEEIERLVDSSCNLHCI